jgi:beta-lactam-binding protein with PASTA domain
MALAACGGGPPEGVPDVRGLSLPDAEAQLKKAGYEVSTTSDATFGVIVEENYTVCSQEDPQGQLVPLEVSKEC